MFIATATSNVSHSLTHHARTLMQATHKHPHTAPQLTCHITTYPQKVCYERTRNSPPFILRTNVRSSVEQQCCCFSVAVVRREIERSPAVSIVQREICDNTRRNHQPPVPKHETSPATIVQLPPPPLPGHPYPHTRIHKHTNKNAHIHLFGPH